MVKADDVAVLCDDGVDIGRELDKLQLALICRECRDGLAVCLRAVLDAKECELGRIVARAVCIVIRRAHGHDGIFKIVLSVIVRDLDCTRAVLGAAERALDRRDCRAPLAENLCDVTRPVDDDADVASMRDDDRMADVGRFLRCVPALLCCVKKSVEAVAWLLLAVLIRDLLVGVGCGRFPLLPIRVEAAGGIPGDDVLALAGIDILEAAASMQDVVAGPNRIVCRPLLVVAGLGIVYPDSLARLSPIKRRYAARELVICLDAQCDEDLIRSAVDAVDVARHD